MIKTRFAPSPTGFLHIGSMRTALYSWLYARQQGGQFLLRIEDTDQTRSTQASANIILEAMDWLGLNYDAPPIYQLTRLERHRYFIQKLLDEGKAYRCDCSQVRLDALRADQLARKLKPRYDGHCRDRARAIERAAAHVIRFRCPNVGHVTFEDGVYGQITVANSELDDLVLQRSNGIPTYNLSVVIDDWEMAISHVIRGEDHLNNTPKQIHLLQAFNAPIPHYAHLPSILDHEGKRLSKRRGAENVLNYRDRGYLPEAFLSYLARLGWSHGDQELFSRDVLIEYFSFKQVHRAGATYAIKKLNWMNQAYLKTYSSDKILASLIKLDPGFKNFPAAAIELLKPRVQTINDFLTQGRYFLKAPTSYPAEILATLATEATLKYLKDILLILESCAWTLEAIQVCFKTYVKQQVLTFKAIAQPLRLAVSGSTHTPSIHEVLFILGKAEVSSRIEQFILKNY